MPTRPIRRSVRHVSGLAATGKNIGGGRSVMPYLAAMLAASIVLGDVSAASALAQPSTASHLVALQKTLSAVTRRVEPAIVAVARFRTLPGRRPAQRNSRAIDPDHPDFIPNEYGTGILVADPRDRSKRLVLTCYHVVRGGILTSGAHTVDHDSLRPLAVETSGPGTVSDTSASQYNLHIRFSNRRGCPARIYAADPRSDLAVLSLDGLKQAGLTPTQLSVLPLTARPTPSKGQFMLMVGDPFAIARDGSASISWALVSNTRMRSSGLPPRSNPGGTIHSLGTLLQLDRRLERGTSGTPIFDLDGHLRGLTTSLAAPGAVDSDSGFAVPINAAIARILGDLLNGLEVEYGFLDAQVEDVSQRQLATYDASFAQPTAARVSRVFRGSPAQRAGIESGDLLLSVAGRRVLGRIDAMREIEWAGPGREIDMVVWRNRTQEKQAIKVVLGKRPISGRDGHVVSHTRHPPWRGLTVDFPTARSRYVPESFEVPHAVVITRVFAGSPASRVGIEPGDFIASVGGQPVETPAEFRRAVNSRRGAVSLKLLDGRQVMLTP